MPEGRKYKSASWNNPALQQDEEGGEAAAEGTSQENPEGEKPSGAEPAEERLAFALSDGRVGVLSVAGRKVLLICYEACSLQRAFSQMIRTRIGSGACSPHAREELCKVYDTAKELDSARSWVPWPSRSCIAQSCLLRHTRAVHFSIRQAYTELKPEGESERGLTSHAKFDPLESEPFLYLDSLSCSVLSSRWQIPNQRGLSGTTASSLMPPSLP